LSSYLYIYLSTLLIDKKLKNGIVELLSINLISMVPINYWAVLVCAIINIFIGALWFGPLFGKTLMQGVNSNSGSGNKSPGLGYFITFIGALLMSFVFAHNLVFASTYTQTFGISAGIMAALWTWIGFIAPLTITGFLWSGKSFKYWILDSGYYLVCLCIMGIILASWK
jgi:hypothetical protein